MKSNEAKIAEVEARLDGRQGITMRSCPYAGHIGSDKTVKHTTESCRFFKAKFTANLYFEPCLNHLYIAEKRLLELK